MSPQNTDRRPAAQRARTSSVYRKTVILGLGIFLWLLGSLALVLMPARTAGTAATLNSSTVAYRSLLTFSPTQVYPITPTVPKKPDPLPSPKARPSVIPAPIEPFPLYLNQEIAVLTAKDRLLYHGNPNLSEIALTFDDGPNPPYTSQILAILQRYGVKATFFCVGRQVEAHPALVKQEYNEGHLIGNHTWAHPYMPYLSTPSIIWQLTTTANILEHTTGERPNFFRPPYGAFNAAVLTNANRYGLTTSMWNVDPRDWSMPGTSVIVARVLYQVQKGSIILMHDGGGDRSQTVAALPMIITQLQQRGFHFVTLQQLVDDLHKTHTRPVQHPLS